MRDLSRNKVNLLGTHYTHLDQLDGFILILWEVLEIVTGQAMNLEFTKADEHRFKIKMFLLSN